ncbi:hypothetical protein RRG08_037442 [Elysia crispata]|uniref:Uncharacterized protein n=1 Tax=Elysia crispata TaxID=231223 RepID=A0AAE0Y5Q3_9GAST|nr:hypothetical protein RRG08_037442 [Elysia crispata]
MLTMTMPARIFPVTSSKPPRAGMRGQSSNQHDRSSSLWQICLCSSPLGLGSGSTACTSDMWRPLVGSGAGLGVCQKYDRGNMSISGPNKLERPENHLQGFHEDPPNLMAQHVLQLVNTSHSPLPLTPAVSLFGLVWTPSMKDLSISGAYNTDMPEPPIFSLTSITGQLLHMAPQRKRSSV